MRCDIPPEEFSQSLDTVADEVLALAEVTGPPVDAVAVAHRLGITIASDDLQPGRARYVRLSGFRGRRSRATILLRNDPRPERVQWALAHEIGEHVAQRVYDELLVDSREVEPMAREDVANRLAGRILLPREWFGQDAARTTWDLLALKAIYRTASHELIARRMLDFSLPVIVTVMDQGKVTLRQGNLPGRVPGLRDDERACWREVHQAGQPASRMQWTHSITAWPIHEAAWKREILRTEFDLP